MKSYVMQQNNLFVTTKCSIKLLPIDRQGIKNPNIF